MKKDFISVKGAREHNLKSVDVTIPKGTLTVITGPSGSGKSSLALDTLYAEGKRRYVESLSSYARQFLGVSKRPDVDKIEGLCPAIAIEQKTVGFNPRSTVGTVTEIYDYLRVLFARVGVPHCSSCDQAIEQVSAECIAQMIQKKFSDQTVMIGAPIAIAKKGEFKNELLALVLKGYNRFWIDGMIVKLRTDFEVDTLDLKKTYQHTLFTIVDRIEVEQSDTDMARINEATEQAVKLSAGLCAIITADNQYHLYSSLRVCLKCARSAPELEPRLFSFNSPLGACRQCNGLGFEYYESDEDYADVRYQQCGACHGARLRPEALSVKVGGQNIYQLCLLSLDQLIQFFNQVTLTEDQSFIAKSLLTEITSRLGFLVEVGLDYLTLGRAVRSLSGGEGQRIRLATQIGSALTGVLYILDEPSIGLHQRDNDRLLTTLKRLRDQGNTVIVVEHDMDTIAQADYVIDIGPAAGKFGGQVTACGTPAELMKNPNSLSGAFLSGRRAIAIPEKRRKPTGFLSVRGVTTNNLKNIDVEIPLGVFVAFSGVSGSGKSSLIIQTLVPALKNYYSLGYSGSVGLNELEGAESLRSMVVVDQSPIGRQSRSNPATYLGFFDDIRALFAGLPESQARGYAPGRFSFNVPDGRCFECRGEGHIKVSMHFLEDVLVLCKSCKGTRYSSQTLEITFKGKNISQILGMSVIEARDFFDSFPTIHRRLDLLCDVGLDYITLGQPSGTLSGGEAQRIKLVDELAKQGKNTLYVLDEPTTGLHSDDIEKLLKVLNRLVERGNTVLVIEHNLDMLKSVDYLIDIGPEGGRNGGHIVAHGTPEAVAKSGKGYTAQYLAQVISPNKKIKKII